jgi:uncharacterized protein
MSAINDNSPMTREDMTRLSDYFSSDKISFFSMYLDEVDGMFAAIACTPDEITPPEWLPLVFGRQDPEFRSVEESEAVIGGLMRMFNQVDRSINGDDVYAPVLSEITNESGEDEVHAERWAGGFIEGMRLREEFWFAEDADELAVLVSALFVLARIDPPELQPAPQMISGPEPVNEKISRLVYMMRDYWRYVEGTDWQEDEAGGGWPEEPIEPCPCGSGKSFMQCCGKVFPALN